MAVSAGMIAKAAATVLSNEKLRKGVGWTLVAILSPVIVLIALLCSIGSGGADHNNQAVAAAFYGVSYSTEVPAEFRYHIEEMRTAFSLLDSAVASVNGQTESGNGLDPIRIKAVFYSLCFGEDAPSARAASRFVECFYTWETRTRTVDIENGDGTVTSTVEESAADGAVLRNRQGRLCPLGKGCSGSCCGVHKRTIPGYDRLLSAQCAPDAGFLAVVQRHAGTAWRSASLELDTERCDHGGRAARRGALLVHPAGYSTESIQVRASANDRGFCVSGKCSRRKGRCVV